MTKPGVAFPKVREPQRSQSSFRVEVIDELISEDHPARLLWDVLGEFDLKPFFAQTRSAKGSTGRGPREDISSNALWRSSTRRACTAANPRTVNQTPRDAK